MLGVSLVTADDWILRYFASSGIGDIARLNYAKRLFAVPIAILGQATGRRRFRFSRASSEKRKFDEFAATVNASVYRITAASLLMTGWMMAIAVPLIDLVYRRGHFTFADSAIDRHLFLLVLALAGIVVGQALYARAFYAAGNTLTPMVASRLITIASLPIYSLLFRTFSVTGLAIASDLGIAANAIAIAAATAYSRHGSVRRIELEGIRRSPRWSAPFPADSVTKSCARISLNGITDARDSVNFRPSCATWRANRG